MSSKSDTNKRWVPSEDYRTNFDRLFGKKEDPPKKTSDTLRKNDLMPTSTIKYDETKGE